MSNNEWRFMIAAGAIVTCLWSRDVVTAGAVVGFAVAILTTQAFLQLIWFIFDRVWPETKPH